MNKQRVRDPKRRFVAVMLANAVKFDCMCIYYAVGLLKTWTAAPTPKTIVIRTIVIRIIVIRNELWNNNTTLEARYVHCAHETHCIFDPWCTSFCISLLVIQISDLRESERRDAVVHAKIIEGTQNR